ncbi:hypothetical protein ACFSDD_22560 [Salipiger marinus]|uniref:hypothetical protein n=1 Tax=Salipiger marinus TaxID=555512 RepID=UPI002BECA6A7|nr:hypothetical protein [Salipiger manganoxidans]MEB3422106.1 hypothetical protein [Salipiger manganoxidans]
MTPRSAQVAEWQNGSCPEHSSPCTVTHQKRSLEIIDTRTHGAIDYLTGALLIIAPYLFGFATGGVEQWLPQLLGAMTIVMSLLTPHELSLAKVIPLKVHLGVDAANGVLLAVSS